MPIRDRVLVTIAGVAPDVDALGLVVELMVQYSGNSPTWWSDYHHVLGYKVGSGLVVKFFACWLANRRSVATLLALAAFHQGRCATCSARAARMDTSGRFPTCCPFPTVSFFLAWGRGYSPLECISKSTNAA